MQTFWIVVLSIFLPIVGIIELFQSKKEAPVSVPEPPVAETPSASKKKKSKTN